MLYNGARCSKWHHLRAEHREIREVGFRAQGFTYKDEWHVFRYSEASTESIRPLVYHFCALTTPQENSMAAGDVFKIIKENEVKFVDLRFTDTKGKEQHV